jgi:seryl-tRNA synthetase
MISESIVIFFYIGHTFKNDLKKYEDKLNEIEYNLMDEALKLPNKTHIDSPIGDETNNELLFVRGIKPQFDFEPMSHLQIGEKYDLFDFDNGAKLTGSKFVFFK